MSLKYERGEVGNESDAFSLGMRVEASGFRVY